MGNNDKIRLTNDEIRNGHYLELDNELYKLKKDLKRKLLRLYIVSFVIFVLICLFYLFIKI